jgi:hypothetical protein
MKQDIKEEWVKRLRSGDYKQVMGRLKIANRSEVIGYCCLGVLCEIAKEHGVVGEVEDREHWPARYYIAVNDPLDVSAYVLPKAVYRWAQIDPDTADMLASCNDYFHENFSAIANRIEAL